MKYTKNIAIIVPVEYATIVNSRLEAHGYGPDNLNIDCENGSGQITYKGGFAPITVEDERGLSLLLDVYPVVQYNITDRDINPLSSLLYENNLTARL
jgi:hypothetical protein